MLLRKELDDLDIYGFDGGGAEILYFEGKPFTGIAEDITGGILCAESEYKDGYLEGIERRYFYPSGKIQLEYLTINNKVEGEFKEWDEDGNLITSSRYLGGQKVSKALAVDVYYQRDGSAKAVGIIFNTAEDTPIKIVTCIIDSVPDYEPGAFYKRELPCIKAVLKKIEEDKENVDLIIIDGYVHLGANRPGLGHKLWTDMPGTNAVIGVAKTKYRDAADNVVEVYRGGSGNPLYISAAGMNLNSAAELIRNMPGEYRMPTILKHLDMLTKQDKIM